MRTALVALPLLALAACAQPSPPAPTPGPSPAPVPAPTPAPPSGGQKISIQGIGTFTLADVTEANALATSIKDQPGMVCWATVETLLTAVNTAPVIGGATMIEITRAGLLSNIAVVCNGIIPFPVP